MKSKRKQFQGKVATAAIRFVGKWLSRKPISKVYQIGEKFGRLIGKVAPARRERAIENLALAMPDLSLAERELLADQTLTNLGRAAFDFLAASGRTKEDIESNTEIIGLEYMDHALERGKGALLITGHLGNWERASSYLSLRGYPLTVIARDADQDDVNQKVNNLRSDSGTTVVARGNSARTILEKLKANEIVGILPDQNANDIFLPFFGQPAGTVLGPGVLHARTGAAIITVVCVYVGNNNWRMEFGEIEKPEQGYSTKGEGMMRAINSWLEGVIREYPDQWLWIHDRWRNAKKQGMIQ